MRDQLKTVQQIQANWEAFAAICGDGSVVTWGSGTRGDSSVVRDQLSNAKQFPSTDGAFVAFLRDGSVATPREKLDSVVTAGLCEIN